MRRLRTRRPCAQIAGSVVIGAKQGTGNCRAREARSAITSQAFTALNVGGLFFPLAGRMGLPARATVTPKLTQLMVWAGSNLGSFSMASESLERLAGLQVSDRRIRRQVESVGADRVAERETLVEQLKSKSLPERRSGNALEESPELGVIMMDGGRFQRRDHFGRSRESDDATCTHWRESKVGCLLQMSSTVSDEDPCPQIPPEYAHASAVREIAKIAEKTTDSEDDRAREEMSDLNASSYVPPRLVTKDVVASGRCAEEFGWHLEAKAFALNFPSAKRSAFVADGLRVNWSIQEKHFPHSVPIADIIHVLSYVWSAAQASQSADAYQRWAQWIWQGDVKNVIAELRNLSEALGKPEQEAPPTDPRYRIQRALTYLSNNAPHMAYDQYRKQGLPLTSAHIESTIKQINRRIKGTEKFWLQIMSECVLQLRADSISDSRPLEQFWIRWQANQSGSNRYQVAC